MQESESNPGAAVRVAGWALALVLGVLIARYSLAEPLARTFPQTALWLNSSNVSALLETVDQNLALAHPTSGSGDRMSVAGAIAEQFKALSEKQRSELRMVVNKVLQNEPVNPSALRILGQLALAQGEEQRAQRLMEIAAKKSLRESVAALWLLEASEQRADFANFVHYADVLLRTRPPVAPFVTWKLTQQSENAEVAALLRTVLAENPPWRASFFANSYAYISDARTPLEQMLSLRGTAAPPTHAEIKSYLDFLVGKKLYELAYYTWLQFLPEAEVAEVGLLSNSSFEKEPSGLPFDWMLGKGKGAVSAITKRSDSSSDRALEVEFGQGRVEFPGVRQLTLLGPGQYKLEGSYKGKLSGRRGLVWRIKCAATSKAIGESAMIIVAEREWKTFDFSFSVPDEDCRAQIVGLELDARSTSETMVSGRIEFDRLSLTRSN